MKNKLIIPILLFLISLIGGAGIVHAEDNFDVSSDSISLINGSAYLNGSDKDH